MVKPQLQNSWDPVTEADLTGFEREIGARLPWAYRDFLLQHNGGNFNNYVVYEYLDRNDRLDSLLINRLYGISEGTNSLKDVYQTIDSYLPKGFLPIGNDGLGNEICIVVSGEDVGSIWLWDHEASTSDKWPPENARRIARSFDKFFADLKYEK